MNSNDNNKRRGHRSLDSLAKRADKRGLDVSTHKAKEDLIIKTTKKELKVKHKRVREEGMLTFMPDVMTGDDRRTHSVSKEEKKGFEKKTKKENAATHTQTKKEDTPDAKPVPTTTTPVKNQLQAEEEDFSSSKNKRQKTVAPGVSVTVSDATWTCSKCSNVNFAKRDVCNTKMCSEKKPGSAPKPVGARPGTGTMVMCVPVITTLQPSHLSSSAAAADERNSDPNLTEAGSWTCPSCNNHNYASRSKCNSKTCNTYRPSGGGTVVMGQGSSKTSSAGIRKPAAPPEPLKKLVWPEQAGPERIAYNEELRARYKADPAILSEEETERAETLLARDERKKAQKVEEKGKKADAKKRDKEFKRRCASSGSRPGRGGGGGRGGPPRPERL